MSFIQSGKISFILGAQFGSEGKGAAAAYVAQQSTDRLRLIVTTNAGVQSGHTSIHNGRKRVLFHLPTAAVVLYDLSKADFVVNCPPIYLNAGAIIDPDVLAQELRDTGFPLDQLFINPNAAVVTQECKDAEGRSDSAQTKIASTRKGVGEALSRKVLRSGQVARDHPYLKRFVRRIDLNERLRAGYSVLAEVPQGFSLGIDQPFYPHTTSRNCTVMQAMSDAGVHPHFYGNSMLVVRTFPIRVGNIQGFNPVKGEIDGLLGHSGDAYPGQKELSWEALGQPAEITTVTKRVRRVFEFSQLQLIEAMTAARPTVVFLSFCDYLKTSAEQDKFTQRIHEAANVVGLPGPPKILYAYGPSTADVTQGTWRK